MRRAAFTRADDQVVLGCDPFGRPNPRLVVAVARAGGLGVLDLEGRASDREHLAAVVARTDRPFAVRVGTAAAAGTALPELPEQVGTVVVRRPDAVLPELLGPVDAGLLGRPGAVLSERGPVDAGFVARSGAVLADLPEQVGGAVGRGADAWGVVGRRVLVEVVSPEEALGAQAAGAHGLIVSGSEAGGRVGDHEAFVLLQHLVGGGLPLWVRGGIGLHSAAAAVAAGATGVVLDAQLALVRECPLDDATRHALRHMDGSETRRVGGHRIYTRPDLPSARVTDDEDIPARLGADIRDALVPIGQDGAFAAGLADRFVTAGGVVSAVRRAIHDHVAGARTLRPLAPGRGVARALGTRYPVVQGPMTRVSDRAGFARAVADGGGLPFLALAVMPGPEVRELLQATAELLGDQPWGVGVLGFVPPELREEQLREIQAVRPPVALIAGGRPSQAAALERDGIDTYLHVPSPGLLDNFVQAGARRFVFEGRECGGHVGPRSSFVLWNAAVERLRTVDDPERLDLLFAGGIHDERSAAAVAALAAPLVERGARIGVLLGTGYLFTEEAVSHGAITPEFQAEAVACRHTVLLETSPGHATRCAATAYVDAFAQTRARLETAGASSQEMWGELETLNLGRLRIASKGIARDGEQLRSLDAATLRAEGMFMLGQVAALRDQVTTIEALHEAVTVGATSLLAGSDVDRRTGPAQVAVHEPPPRLDVAIVGMAAVMPGARDVEELWANILAGVDAVGEVPADRWDVERYYATGLTPSRWGGFLPRVGFDALAYGIPPKSLASIEPVQLLALRAAEGALADAGYARREFDRARASVVFGAEAGTDLSAAYGLRALLPSHLPVGAGLPAELDDYLPELTEDSFPGVLANVIAGRIANRLDLGGVNYTVDAACAASLAALDLACKELVEGTSDLVLCGGADLHNGINDFLLFASVHALSPRGRCRTFDATADGIVLGEGVACLALKRVADAERDGDRIYAVVEAVRGSSDGRALGLTAPRGDGQRRALERAYAQARRSPAGIGLVEAHGTGTVAGDATELTTLTELFGSHGAAPRSVVLGSVKSQIGHTKCAAGLAGVIKATRAVYHGALPPTIGLDEPNPHYDEDKSPFRFESRSRPWADGARRAGVSAFGFGGTNFHAVLSSYDGDDGPRHGTAVWPAELFLVRAATREAADERLQRLAATLDAIAAADPDSERHRLRDLARTVWDEGTGPVQVALVAADLADLRRQLAGDPAFVRTGDVADAPAGTPVAFLFPGQGSQRVDMLADLFVTFPPLQRHLRDGAAWAPYIFPPRAFSPEGRALQDQALTDTRVAQPALGVVELALADLLGSVGVRPAALGGHSYGELVALAVGGALDARPLLALSAARGTAIHEAAAAQDDPGTMAAVAQAEVDLTRHPDVVVANRNSPRQTVVAGPTAAVTALVEELRAAGVGAKRLPVACAFHSPVVAGAREALAERVAAVVRRAPALPVWSTTTAAPYPDDAAATARLVTEQVASPVRFAEMVESMYAAGARVFVEVGPGRVLSGLLRDILGDRPHVAVPCDVRGDNGVRRFLLALAELAVHGVDVDPGALFADRAERVDLDALPVPAPGWTVDGQLVRTADGEPVAGGLRPMGEAPLLSGGMGTVPPAGARRDDVVAEYLRNLRETVAAERDVLLRYLGEAPEPKLRQFSGDDPQNGRNVEAEPAPATTPAPTATATPAPVLSRDELERMLVEIVADHTGYPHDMLGPELDLEADLSIDSIKRIEIIGEVATRVAVPMGDTGGIDEAVVEELAQIKTLAGIVEWLVAHIGDDAASSTSGAAAAPAHLGGDHRVDDGALALPVDGEATPDVPEQALRYVVELVDAPAEPASPDIAGAHFAVTGEGAGVVAAALRAAGATTEEPMPGDASPARADGVVHLALGHDAGAPGVFARLGATGARWLVCVSAGTGGEVGFMRALAQELPDRVVRHIEVDPGAAPDALAAVVLDELGQTGPVDVVRDGEQRRTRGVRLTDRPADRPAGEEGTLPEGAVVLLTGGARGITALFAESLAQRGARHIELVGRSELPGDEPDDLADALDERAVRAAILRRGDDMTPAAVEALCRRTLADREIRATLRAVRVAGAEVRYHPADVRDPAALASVVADVYARHDRLDGVVHGAGVIEDRRLADKTAESFHRVYDTKVAGARTLLDTVRDDVGFVVFFGSVSGVFGNKGQVDYAAANDTLDVLARSAKGPVLSIDWGPWDGSGMVSDALARAYAERGVGLIDPADGVAAFWAELAAGLPDRQVVVMRARP